MKETVQILHDTSPVDTGQFLLPMADKFHPLILQLLFVVVGGLSKQSMTV